MPVTPTGPLSTPMTALQDLLAASATFQSWVGAPGNAADAEASVHLVGLPEATGDEGHTRAQLEAARPFAILDIEPNGGGYKAERIAGGAAFGFADSGRLIAVFQDGVAAELRNNYRDAKLAFTNKLGAVLQEVCALAGSGSYLRVFSVEIVQGPERGPEDQVNQFGDFMLAWVVFEWAMV